MLACEIPLEGPLLAGKTAVVTAGAGAFGAANCELFAAEGAALVVADIHEQRTTELVERLASAGTKAVRALADVASRAGAEEVVKITFDNFGAADLLINGVGEAIGGIGPFKIAADGGTLAAGGWFQTTKRWTNQPLLTRHLEEDPAMNEARPPMVQ
jgi:NAD(P)-dependent dehydrogenase (short-subunit alcohol dehydrogenase family)